MSGKKVLDTAFDMRSIDPNANDETTITRNQYYEQLALDEHKGTLKLLTDEEKAELEAERVALDIAATEQAIRRLVKRHRSDFEYLLKDERTKRSLPAYIDKGFTRYLDGIRES